MRNDNVYYPKLKEQREKYNVSQAFIASILHTTQQQYYKYEKGIQEIPLHRLIALAKYYDVSIDYLVGLSDIEKVSC